VTLTPPSGSATPTLAGRLEQEHRRLDELFGRFLAAAHAGDAAAARSAIEDFDGDLRRHTAFEEERLYPAPPSRKLAPPQVEDEPARRFRELRLEHVQVRELSGMLRRLLEAGDLDAARRLAGSLARRWDAHTTREQKEVFGSTG
jgi:hypothetical protein